MAAATNNRDTEGADAVNGHLHAYRLEVPLTLVREIGRDPARLSEQEMAGIAATRCLQLCGSLFWLVRRLALMGVDHGWVYTPSDYYAALEALGELGQATAAAADEHLARLVALAARDERPCACAGQSPRGKA